MCMYMCIYIYIYMCMCMCVCKCVYVYMWIYLCIHVYIYKYKKRYVNQTDPPAKKLHIWMVQPVVLLRNNGQAHRSLQNTIDYTTENPEQQK